MSVHLTYNVILIRDYTLHWKNRIVKIANKLVSSLVQLQECKL